MLEGVHCLGISRQLARGDLFLEMLARYWFDRVLNRIGNFFEFRDLVAEYQRFTLQTTFTPAITVSSILTVVPSISTSLYFLQAIPFLRWT